MKNIFLKRKIATVKQNKNFQKIAILGLFLAFFGHADEPVKKSQISSTTTSQNNLLKQFESKMKNIKSLEINFEQIQKNATSGMSKKTFGKIFLERPSFYHWISRSAETKKEESLLVSNGDKIWFYIYPENSSDGRKEPGQVMIRKASDTQSKLAIDVLTGQSKLAKDFKAKPLTPTSFELTPVKNIGDIDHLELHIENSTKLVYKLILFTLLGNRTELIFHKIVLNPKLKKELFYFKVPKGTQEIQ